MYGLAQGRPRVAEPPGITDAKSCNVAMMRIGAKDRKRAFYQISGHLWVCDKTGIDLPRRGGHQRAGLQWTTSGPRTWLPMPGQNYNCTMVQLSRGVLARFWNGGPYYEPHVVKQILTSVRGGEKVEPVLVVETVSQSTSDFLKEAMSRPLRQARERRPRSLAMMWAARRYG